MTSYLHAFVTSTIQLSAVLCEKRNEFPYIFITGIYIVRCRAFKEELTSSAKILENKLLDQVRARHQHAVCVPSSCSNYNCRFKCAQACWLRAFLLLQLQLHLKMCTSTRNCIATLAPCVQVRSFFSDVHIANCSFLSSVLGIHFQQSHHHAQLTLTY
jgi:hypothetical protein